MDHIQFYGLPLYGYIAVALGAVLGALVGWRDVSARWVPGAIFCDGAQGIGTKYTLMRDAKVALFKSMALSAAWLCVVIALPNKEFLYSWFGPSAWTRQNLTIYLVIMAVLGGFPWLMMSYRLLFLAVLDGSWDNLEDRRVAAVAANGTRVGIAQTVVENGRTYRMIWRKADGSYLPEAATQADRLHTSQTWQHTISSYRRDSFIKFVVALAFFVGAFFAALELGTWLKLRIFDWPVFVPAIFGVVFADFVGPYVIHRTDWKVFKAKRQYIPHAAVLEPFDPKITQETVRQEQKLGGAQFY